MKEFNDLKALSSNELLEYNGGSSLTYWICYGLGKIWKAYEESMEYNQAACSSAM